MREPAIHHPPHVYLDDTWYAITAATKSRDRLFAPPGYKDLVRDKLKSLVVEFKLHLAAWVILDNHYHLLVKLDQGARMSTFIQRLHGSTSHEINKRDGARGRMVWHNYWDTCIRGEHDYWTRFNYIHHNPVKHGYVTDMADWPYSSYRWYMNHKGADWLADALRRYPIRDYTDDKDTP